MSVLEDIGDNAIEHLAYVGRLSMQFWSSLLAIPRILPVVGRRGRWLAAIQQMAEIGVDALPMIATVSVSAGFIFAMQSGNELRRFGALSLVIDIIAIGFTRELGPLLTAIVVSSRFSCGTLRSSGCLIRTRLHGSSLMVRVKSVKLSVVSRMFSRVSSMFSLFSNRIDCTLLATP